MEKVIAYKCGYCHRCFGRKVNAMRHEESCGNNPTRRRCITCKHCSLELGEMKYPHFEGDEGYQDTTPTCLINNIAVHDKAYEQECDTSDYYGCSERPSPGTCWNYKYKGYAKYEKSTHGAEPIEEE
jgi:hypothetical protein